MNITLLTLTLSFFASTLVLAEEVSAGWRDDRKLLETYHSDLEDGRIEKAILRVVTWCTAKYEAGVADGSLMKPEGERLITEIQEAAKALEFILENQAEIKKLDDGTQTFGIYLGCFESLFDMHPVRDGSGKIYEQFIKAYYAGRDATKSMLSPREETQRNE